MVLGVPHNHGQDLSWNPLLSPLQKPVPLSRVGAGPWGGVEHHSGGHRRARAALIPVYPQDTEGPGLQSHTTGLRDMSGHLWQGWERGPRRGDGGPDIILAPLEILAGQSHSEPGLCSGTTGLCSPCPPLLSVNFEPQAELAGLQHSIPSCIHMLLHRKIWFRTKGLARGLKRLLSRCEEWEPIS